MVAVLARERLRQNELIDLGYEVLLEVLSRFFARTDETDERPDALSRARSASRPASCGPRGIALPPPVLSAVPGRVRRMQP